MQSASTSGHERRDTAGGALPNADGNRPDAQRNADGSQPHAQRDASSDSAGGRSEPGSSPAGSASGHGHGPHDANRPKHHRLSAILKSLADADGDGDSDADRVTLTVGEIVDRTRRAGFGFLFAFMAICAMPFPGLSVPFGLMIALGAIQLMLGFRKPWLPQRIRRHAVSKRTLGWLSEKLAKYTSWLERIARPRFVPLTYNPLAIACGLALLFHAVGLSLPLPIPFSNILFVIPIVLYAIGILESDGLIVGVCHVITVAYLMLAVKFSHLIVKGLEVAWQALESARHWLPG